MGDRDTSWGFLKWQSGNILLFVVVVFWWVLFYSTLASATSEQLLAVFVALAILTYSGYVVSTRIGRNAISMRLDMSRISRECARMSSGMPPSATLVNSLTTLRESLRRYVRDAGTGLYPINSYYQSEVSRQIDVAFSCILETLYERYWTITRHPSPPHQLTISIGTPEFSEPPSFDYSILRTWTDNLRVHLVGSRKWLTSSLDEISTFKYFLRDWMDFFEKNHPATYELYAKSVDEYYDRMERANSARSERLTGLAYGLTVSIIGALSAYLFDQLAR